MKRSIYAAFAAATALLLQPAMLGDAHSSSAVTQLADAYAGLAGTQPADASSSSAGPVLAAARNEVRLQTQTIDVGAEEGNVEKVQPAASITGAATAKVRRIAKARRRLSSKANPKIAKRALTVAQEMNTVGWCYKGVCTALRPFGINLSGAAAYEAKDQLLKDGRFTAFTIHGVGDLKPGDILVHGASTQKPYGHIAVYLGNSNEASDHVQQVVLNGPYNGTTVFRYGAVVAGTESSGS